VVLPEGVEIRELYKLAAERDLQLRRLTYRRDTLEDIFLKAMESPRLAPQAGQEVANGRL
jgi:ABC-2 type transport system ATP-binding protein